MKREVGYAIEIICKCGEAKADKEARDAALASERRGEGDGK